MYMRFLHDVAPEKYPLENEKSAMTTSKMAGSAEAGMTQTKIPALEKVMAKIKNVVKILLTSHLRSSKSKSELKSSSWTMTHCERVMWQL